MDVKVDEKVIAELRRARIFFENKNGPSRLKIGDVLSFDENASVEPYCGVLVGHTVPTMGSFSYSWSRLKSDMEIGRYCSIAAGLQVPGPRHTIEYVSTSSFMYDRNFSIIKSAIEDSQRSDYNNFVNNTQKGSPRIGNDVWIGSNVTLLPGVTIGNGAVIAANSVVTKDVAPYSVMGGNKAERIKWRFEAGIINRLEELAWWKFHFTDFAGSDLRNPDKFIEFVGSQKLSEFTPNTFPLRTLSELWKRQAEIVNTRPPPR